MGKYPKERGEEAKQSERIRPSIVNNAGKQGLYCVTTRYCFEGAENKNKTCAFNRPKEHTYIPLLRLSQQSLPRPNIVVSRSKASWSHALCSCRDCGKEREPLCLLIYAEAAEFSATKSMRTLEGRRHAVFKKPVLG